MNQQIEQIKKQIQNLLNETTNTRLIETAEVQNRLLDILNNITKIETK